MEEARRLQVHGLVTRRRVAPGSKSERDAVVLDSDNGQTYLLRRKDGPAFGDPQLDNLVGRSIAAEGVGLGELLIIHDWRPDE